MSALAINHQPGALESGAWAEDEQQCHVCGQLGNDVQELGAELEQCKRQLAKAHQVLRAVRKIEPRPAKCVGFDDDATANTVVAYAETLAGIKARIDLYLAAVPEVRS